MLWFTIPIIILLTIKTTNGSPQCDLTKCGKESRILNGKQTNPVVTINEAQATVTKWEPSEEIIVTYRRRYTAYCYQGTILDKNTGCDSDLKTHNMEREEAIKNSEEGKCPTGYECTYHGCVGELANRCLMDNLVNDIGPRSLGLMGGNLDYLARHTCVSRWECSIRKMSVRTNLMHIDGQIKRFFTTSDGQTILLDTKHYKMGTKTWDGRVIFSIKKSDPTPTSHTTTLKCYSSSMENIKCTDKSDETDSIDIESLRLQGFKKSSLYTIITPVFTIKEGLVVKIYPKKEAQQGTSQFTYIEESVQKAPNIEKIQEIITGLKITQMQQLYNTFENRVAIRDIEKALANLLKYLSKIYPMLLSSIFSESFRTRWLNDEVFQICPCQQKETIPTHSNCYKGKQYFQGEIINKTSKAGACMSIDENKIQDISITEARPLDAEILDYSPPQEAASDSSIWDWMVKERLQEFEFSQNRTTDPSPSFYDPFGIMSSVNSGLIYFCTIVCIIYVLQTAFETWRR